MYFVTSVYEYECMEKCVHESSNRCAPGGTSLAGLPVLLAESGAVCLHDVQSQVEDLTDLTL